MKHKFVSLFLLFAALFVSAEINKAEAQEMRVKAELDTTQIILGDQIYLQLEIEKQVGVEINFPELNDSITSTIEVISQEPTQTVEKDGKEILSRRYLITSYDSGQHVIPPLYFRFKTESLEDSIKSKALVLNVATFDVDLQKGPTDIKKPYEAKVTFKEAVPYILGVFFVGALLFFLFYAIHRYRNKKTFFTKPPVPKEPAHIIALRDLEGLKGEEAWKSMEGKAFFTSVTDILRVYMEERFQIQAMESTTEEILDDLKSGSYLKNEKATLNELKEVLQLADLVKFAKLPVTEDENRLTLANAVFFVNKTKIELVVDNERPQTDAKGDGNDEAAIKN